LSVLSSLVSTPAGPSTMAETGSNGTSACLSPLPTRFARTSRVGRPTPTPSRMCFLHCPSPAKFGAGWPHMGSVTGHCFPMSVPVLLTDERRPWCPAPEAEALWVRLRLLSVVALWRAHCCRHHGDRAPLLTVLRAWSLGSMSSWPETPSLSPPTGPSSPPLGEYCLMPLPALIREAFLSR
jgi:hypothetical protein